MPPSDSRFAPWTMVRGDDGTIYYASGVWRDAKDHDVAEPKALSTGVSSAGEIVNPEGERENTSQSVHASGDRPAGPASRDAGVAP